MALTDFTYRERRSPAAKLPLAALLDRLRQFTPPPKSPGLLEAEAALDASTREFECAQKEFNRACLAWREQDAQRHPVVGAPNRDELNRMESNVAALNARALAARDRLEIEMQPWRVTYWQAMESEVLPVRIALHQLADELDAGMQAFWHLSHQATINDVGAAWIVRTASEILPPLQFVRDRLAIDAKLLASELHPDV